MQERLNESVLHCVALCNNQKLINLAYGTCLDFADLHLLKWFREVFEQCTSLSEEMNSIYWLQYRNSIELIFSMPTLSNPVCVSFCGYCCRDFLSFESNEMNSKGCFFGGCLLGWFLHKQIQFKVGITHLEQRTEYRRKYLWLSFNLLSSRNIHSHIHSISLKELIENQYFCRIH